MPSFNLDQADFTTPVTRENLPPALRAFYHTGQRFPIIAHPLIHEVMPSGPKLIAARYEEKHRRFREQVRKKNWDCALAWIEKPWKLHVLYRWWKGGAVKDTELPELLLDAWTYVENCHEYQDEALEMFMAAGYTGDVPAPPKSHVIDIYRGQDAANEPGMSWTTNPLKAEWFAKRFSDNPVVLIGTVIGCFVLARYDGRGEAEIIVDPYHVDVTETKYL